MNKLVTLIIALCSAGPAFAQTPSLPPATVEKVERLVADAIKEHNVPGLSAAVVNKQSAWAKGFGKADLENDVPATDMTVYRLASVSKPITAIMAMALVEQGKLDLDAPVQKYVPNFPEKEHPILVRHLLCHQSGIRHYSRKGVPLRDELENTHHFTSLSDGLAMFQYDPLLHPPGAKFSYTTHGYTLLGCVLEGAGGKPYLELLQDLVIGPAGLATLRGDDVRAIIPHRAQGYRRNNAGKIENSTLLDPSYKIPGGGLCTSAPDLAKLAAGLMDDKVINAKTRKQMWTRQKLTDGTETAMALGWTVGKHNGRMTATHSGAQPRVSTLLYLEPNDGMAVVLLCNLEGQRLRPLADKIAALLHE